MANVIEELRQAEAQRIIETPQSHDFTQQNLQLLKSAADVFLVQTLIPQAMQRLIKSRVSREMGIRLTFRSTRQSQIDNACLIFPHHNSVDIITDNEAAYARKDISYVYENPYDFRQTGFVGFGSTPYQSHLHHSHPHHSPTIQLKDELLINLGIEAAWSADGKDIKPTLRNIREHHLPAGIVTYNQAECSVVYDIDTKRLSFSSAMGITEITPEQYLNNDALLGSVVQDMFQHPVLKSIQFNVEERPFYGMATMGGPGGCGGR